MKFFNMFPSVSDRYALISDTLSGDIRSFFECPCCKRDVLNTQSLTQKDYENAEFSFKLASGKILPDYMLTHRVFEVYSARAVDAFTKDGITGFIPYKISNIVYEGNYKGPPIHEDYYVMRITGKAEYDYNRMGSPNLSTCPCCGSVILEDTLDTDLKGFQKPHYEETFLLEGSWNGQDIFNGNLCTEKVLRTVYDHRLKGFCFEDGKYTEKAFSRASKIINLGDYFEDKESFRKQTIARETRNTPIWDEEKKRKEPDIGWLTYYAVIADHQLNNMGKLSEEDLIERAEELEDEGSCLRNRITELFDALHFVVTGGAPTSELKSVKDNPLRKALVGVHVYNGSDRLISVTKTDELQGILDLMKAFDFASRRDSFNEEALRDAGLYSEYEEDMIEDMDYLWEDLEDEYKGLISMYHKALEQKMNIMVIAY
ncbi:MAG: YfbM family protein [Clostridiales Family XIII bacterium]|jgi:hypothetical protein|nr:YfbM family protein [Clostridiales Family XIII bacterium]